MLHSNVVEPKSRFTLLCISTNDLMVQCYAVPPIWDTVCETEKVANHDVKRVTTGVIRDMFRLKGHQIPQGQFSQTSSNQSEPPQQQSVIRQSVVVPIQQPTVPQPIQPEPRMGALMHEDVLEDLTVSFDM